MDCFTAFAMKNGEAGIGKLDPGSKAGVTAEDSRKQESVLRFLDIARTVLNATRIRSVLHHAIPSFCRP
ncbi:hypothetical protein [Tsuneonella suprasediminis]|uniref:hypothetical protein n=1 Tax=Tsuneonella suprasediminis TaxID=2306996 RepID=UPI002F95D90E